ncbi:MAG: GyrI-like domain-containing protein [Ekhidna sp.]|nr:GyrI-like domain-containing protein [Ekhidna sp.]
MEAVLEKLNLQKEDRHYYYAAKKPVLLDLDSYYYLSIAGQGNPKSADFMKALDKLYSVAYAVKFICKSADMDFVVPKMEGYWWIDGGLDVQHLFPDTPADQWNWKITIRMPDFVEGDHYYRAMQQVKSKNPGLLDEDEVILELINDGLCVQSLHIGSYDEEQETIDKIMKFASENGLEINGYHHEIYLSDPRKTAEEKLRTILRYSVKRRRK